MYTKSIIILKVYGLMALSAPDSITSDLDGGTTVGEF